MAASGFTPISLYYSTTAAAVPTSGNLANGELAINITDGKLYYKNNSGVVTLLAGATAGPAGGSTTQVQYNNAGVLAGITGATTNGTALTLVAPVLGTPTSGVATNLTGLPLTTGVTGTLPTANGGTNLTSFTSGGVVYASSSSALATGSALTFDGTNLGIAGRMSITTTTSPNAQGQWGYNATGGTYIFSKAGSTQDFILYRSDGNSGLEMTASGNLGLGVTPSAWGSTYKAFQAGTTGVIAGIASQTDNFVFHSYANAFYDTSWKYIASQEAGRYELARNVHKWFNAPSGTAGNAISFTQAMTLDASGNLLVGTTSIRSTGYSTNISQYAMETTGYGGAQWFVNRTDDEGAFIVLGKSKGATVNSNTVVANADTLGAVIWEGTTGSGVAPAAQIRAKVDGATISASSMPGRLEFYTTPSGSITMSERLRIASTGAFGLSGANYGTNGQVLTSGGSAAAPTWTTVSGASQWVTSGSNIYYTTGAVSIGTTSVNGSRLTTYGTADDTSVFFQRDTGSTAPTTYPVIIRGDSGGSNTASFAGLSIIGANGVGNSSSMRVGCGVPATYVYHDTTFVSMYGGGLWQNGAYHWSTNGATTYNGADYNGCEFYNHLSDGQYAFTFNSANTSFGSSVMFIRCARTTTNSTYNLFFGTNGNGTGQFAVRDSGNCVNTNNSYGSISDIKLKQDIVDASTQWDDIKNLRIRKFRWKSEVLENPNAKQYLGLIAQEAELVSPNLIEETDDYEEVEEDSVGDDGNVALKEDGTPHKKLTRRELGTVTKTVKYSILYMKAIKALQEAMDRIEQLEARVAALETI